MRIHKVVAEGFGPFKGIETVDFDAFASDGIFLITGRTGSGKTSILDAVTFALYGSAPRYEGQVQEKVRSDYLEVGEPSRVELELTLGDSRYRITRTPGYDRPKLRGEGMVWQQPTAQLDRLMAGEWECLESQIRNVEMRIAEIVRLSRDQFLQVVLLAQGQFQEFLVADSDQRRDLLRKLFGTVRFGDYSDALQARARELSSNLEKHRGALAERISNFAMEAGVDHLERPLDELGDRLRSWVAGLINKQHAELNSKLEREQSLELISQQVDAEHYEANQQADGQRRRNDARARKAQLDAEIDEISALRSKLLLAQKADKTKLAIDGWESAKANLDARLKALETSQAGYLAVWPELPIDQTVADAQVDELARQIGVLEPLVAEEVASDALKSQLGEAREAIQTHDREREQLLGARNLLRAEVEQAELSLVGLDAAASGLPSVEASKSRIDEQLAAARQAEQLSKEVAQARESSLAAGERQTTASAERDRLRRSQLEGFAGALGQNLVPGEACPVCGSNEHPHPATMKPDHVGEQAVDEAERLLTDAIQASRSADAELQRLVDRQADQNQRAGGRIVSELEPASEQANAKVRDLRLVVAQIKMTRQRVADLREAIEKKSREVELAQSERERLVADLYVTTQKHAEVAARLTKAREGFVTIQDRLADVRSRLQLSRLLLEATRLADDATTREREETSRLAKAIADAGFASMEDAKASLLSATEQQRIDALVSVHEVHSAATAEVLADPQLKDLPEEPVDVEATLAAKIRAADELRQAVVSRSTAESRLQSMSQAQGGITSLATRVSQTRDQQEVVDRLARTIRGQEPNTMKMQLEAFVLAAELEEIVQAANARLRDMTSGRYELQHSDSKATHGRQSGLALSVMDAHTGEGRSPESLSGGEKFQASLALALGLAEVVTNRAGGMRFDTLFIDEGFGSLDSDTLETTMSTLDGLRECGRTVGLISHVESMKEAIPAQLHVKRVAGGWSVIERDG